jgi:hypothetical protein
LTLRRPLLPLKPSKCRARSNDWSLGVRFSSQPLREAVLGTFDGTFLITAVETLAAAVVG